MGTRLEEALVAYIVSNSQLTAHNSQPTQLSHFCISPGTTTLLRVSWSVHVGGLPSLSIITMSVNYLQEFVPQSLLAAETFPPNGVGPFVVTREDLVSDIVDVANPQRSVHMSGCRGAGKTTVLHHIAAHLLAKKKTVFFLRSANSILVDPQLSEALTELMKSKARAYVLLDETQDANSTDETLISLLKKRKAIK